MKKLTNIFLVLMLVLSLLPLGALAQEGEETLEAAEQGDTLLAESGTNEPVEEANEPAGEVTVEAGEESSELTEEVTEDEIEVVSEPLRLAAARLRLTAYRDRAKRIHRPKRRSRSRGTYSFVADRP